MPPRLISICREPRIGRYFLRLNHLILAHGLNFRRAILLVFAAFSDRSGQFWSAKRITLPRRINSRLSRNYRSSQPDARPLRGFRTFSHGLSHTARTRSLPDPALSPSVIRRLGVRTASYGGSGRAILDVRKPANAVGLGLLATDTLFYANCTDFDSWVADWLPLLSVFPMLKKPLARIASLAYGLPPPAADPFLFILARRQRINEADKTDEGCDHLRGRVRFLNNTDSYSRPRARSASKPPKPAGG